MTNILDRLFDRSYDLEETLHDAHTEIKQLRAAITRARLKATTIGATAGDVVAALGADDD